MFALICSLGIVLICQLRVRAVKICHHLTHLFWPTKSVNLIEYLLASSQKMMKTVLVQEKRREEKRRDEKRREE